nr:prolipoprotein diacylglyceryl transferase [Bacteroidia bacterium]
MYATISDLLRDLFGLNIPLPIQTFGFMMALSFVAAYMATNSELKRKEANGLLKPFKVKKKINEKISPIDYVTAITIGAFIGFKFLEMVLDYDALVENPQKFILSAKGSWFGAILGGVYSYYQKKKEADALKGKQEQIIEVETHPYELMGNIVAIAAVGGILGAKIFHNLENLDELMADPIGSLISFSGLTFYGGLIVAAIGIIYYVKKYGISPLAMSDAAAAGLMLAYGIGRVGCH